MHAGKLGRVTNFRSTVVGGSAMHCIDQHMAVSIQFTRGQHCYAGRATC